MASAWHGRPVSRQLEAPVNIPAGGQEEGPLQQNVVAQEAAAAEEQNQELDDNEYERERLRRINVNRQKMGEMGVLAAIHQ